MPELTWHQVEARKSAARDAALARQYLVNAHEYIGELVENVGPMRQALDRIVGTITAVSWYKNRQEIEDTCAALADARTAVELLLAELERAHEAFSPVIGEDQDQDEKGSK